jgi:hypothetical protein
MAAIASAGTLKDQIQKAITAHGVYKVRFVFLVETGSNDMPAAAASSDLRCPIGEWLYNGLTAEDRAGTHYKTVKELHAAFHRACGEVMAISLAHKRTEALEAMGMGSTFKVTSSKLVTALSDWHDSL